MSVIQFSSIANILRQDEIPSLPELKTKPKQDTNFDKMIKTWGNGDYTKGLTIFHLVTMRLEHARNKHPVWVKSGAYAHQVIGSEYSELEHAIEHESPARQQDEALDVIATCLRFIAGEHIY